MFGPVSPILDPTLAVYMKMIKLVVCGPFTQSESVMGLSLCYISFKEMLFGLLKSMR